MTGKNFIYFLFFIKLISSNNLHAFYEAFEEDLEESKKRPLISGINEKEILENGKAAITVCTTPIKGFLDFVYDHVYLVFEIKDTTNPKEIDLFSIHFGGDGHSSHIREGCPIFDNRRDTLIKVHRGKKVDFLNSTDKNNLKHEIVKPIYSREVKFTIEEEKAFDALKKVQNDTDLQYSLCGDPFGIWGPNTYNCVTYANKILKYCGIDTKFDSLYYVKKNAGNFINCCDAFIKAQELKIPDADIKLPEYPETSPISQGEGKNYSSEKECQVIEDSKRNTELRSDTSIYLKNLVEHSSNDMEEKRKDKYIASVREKNSSNLYRPQSAIARAQDWRLASQFFSPGIGRIYSHGISWWQFP